jgi:hypothetical protein
VTPPPPPAHAGIPLIGGEFIEEHDEPINVLGVKCIGEHPVSGVAPAIASAVHHVTGRRIDDLPVRPEMLIKGVSRLVNAVVYPTMLPAPATPCVMARPRTCRTTRRTQASGMARTETG